MRTTIVLPEYSMLLNDPHDVLNTLTPIIHLAIPDQ